MHRYKVEPAVILLTALVSQMSAASDWNITQSSAITGASPELNQVEVSSSNQALNAIVLDSDTDSVTNAEQTTTLNGGTISLRQTGSINDANVQAVNLASAQSINNLRQEVSGFDNVEIVQSSAAGSGNVQALNYSIASNNTANLRQVVVGETLSISDSTSGNVQALNYAESATYTGVFEQTATLSSANITNLGGQYTRINSVQGNTGGVIGGVNQTAIIGTVTVNGGSTLILNHIKP